ncbi:MAG: 3-dehydroquinate synthase [Dehalococcoidales bacterium]|nr:3-dehydroquinate synthase [Dehalococcoidales bacterium]
MASMKKVHVELGDNSYEIRIGSGLLERAGLWMKEYGYTGKAVIITDATVRDLYAGKLEKGLKQAGFTVTVLTVPPGEEHKTLETAAKLYGDLARAYAERTSPVFALGGGVIGDLAGFVAATYMRGLPLVQVPTTLLAQVDSSVGGKTAVDYGEMKNMVGTFYQPKMVIADMETLQTLPEIELVNGMGEVIKHAAIRSELFFEFLEKNLPRIMNLDESVLQAMITDNVKIKADVVGKDERETGLREILNYGHTVGHAVETVTGFSLKHGHSIAIGMVAAARLSSRMGILGERDAARLEDLIARVGLPTHLPDINKLAVVEAMRHDKKVRADKIRFVLLRTIGHSFVADDVDPDVVEEVLRGWS